jgi:hypothetical protein
MYIHIYIGLQDMQSSDLAEGTDVSTDMGTDMGTGGMDSGHTHMKMTEALFTAVRRLHSDSPDATMEHASMGSNTMFDPNSNMSRLPAAGKYICVYIYIYMCIFRSFTFTCIYIYMCIYIYGTCVYGF